MTLNFSADSLACKVAGVFILNDFILKHTKVPSPTHSFYPSILFLKQHRDSIKTCGYKPVTVHKHYTILQLCYGESITALQIPGISYTQVSGFRAISLTQYISTISCKFTDAFLHLNLLPAHVYYFLFHQR